MIVRAIALDFFRNYLHLEAEFHPGINVIYGENAQGKTNLLEAVAYLSTASCHRARYDRELIQFGVDSAFVKAEVLCPADGTSPLEARLSPGQRRQLYSNGVRLKTAGELAGSAQHRAVLPGGPVSDPGGGGGAAAVSGRRASASCGPGTPQPWSEYQQAL